MDAETVATVATTTEVLMPRKTRGRPTQDATCRVKITQGGVEFEFEGPEAFVLSMLARYESGAARLPASPKHPSAQTKPEATAKAPPAKDTSVPGKSLSLGEFIRQLGFKRHTDFVLAFGYYMEKMRGVAEFTAADLNNCYYEAKMDTSNTSQMIIQNIKRGFMMEGKGGNSARRAYTLTRSGEDYLEKVLTPSDK